jgi:FkbM family methyltransferase
MIRKRNGTVVWNEETGIYFFVTNETDEIQSFNFRGQFYEKDDLDTIASFARKGMVFVDVGANVGNHALYFASALEASKVFVFEPNRDAFEILQINMRLNGLSNVDGSHLGKALSDKTAKGSVEARFPNNLGYGVMREDAAGQVQIVVGDAILARERVDFLKIDVEGWEMSVLRGLPVCIRNSRPTIYIEVDNGNGKAFQQWVTEHQYSTVKRIKRYVANENFLLIATERLHEFSASALDEAGQAKA